MSTEILELPDLHRIADVCWGEIMKFCQPDACVLGVRVLKDVLAALGEPDCEGLTVLGIYMNPPAALHSVEHGCGPDIRNCPERKEPMMVVVLGERPHDVRDSVFWKGHLVAVVRQQFLLDISISQASRPEQELMLEGTLAGEVLPDFLSGEQSLDGLTENGLRIFYQAVPEISSEWQSSPDWGPSSLLDELVAGSLARLRGEEPCYPAWLELVRTLAGRV